LSNLYNGGEGRIIESDEEDLILLALFNENYDDSTGTFTSPTLTGTETYDDPLVTDARGPLEPKMRFIPGLAMIKSNGEVLFYLEDALGSVMALANDEEAVTGVYQYDAWGNALVEPEDDTNPYRWCGMWGYYWDANAQMYLLGLRWYDPHAGRFITQDPIGFAGSGINLFAYTANNPLNITDPIGLGFWKSLAKGLVKGLVVGFVTAGAVTAVAVAVVAAAPAAAAAVTGTLLVAGAVGLIVAVASTVTSVVEVAGDPSDANAEKLGFNLGALGGAALGGRATGRFVSTRLSPPGHKPEPGAKVWTWRYECEHKWRYDWNQSFGQNWSAAMRTGPTPIGAAASTAGTAAGTDITTDEVIRTIRNNDSP
jgi:RHS repeat-associated protein